MKDPRTENPPQEDREPGLLAHKIACWIARERGLKPGACPNHSELCEIRLELLEIMGRYCRVELNSKWVS